MNYGFVNMLFLSFRIAETFSQHDLEKVADRKDKFKR